MAKSAPKIQMKKYIPKKQYPIEAMQWWKHGDHPEVKPYPNNPEYGLFCPNYWEGDFYILRIVKPGDYFSKAYSGIWIHHDKKVFENSWKEL